MLICMCISASEFQRYLSQLPVSTFRYLNLPLDWDNEYDSDLIEIAMHLLRWAVRLVQAERLAARRHQPEHGRCPGRRASRTRAACASSSSRDRRRADDPRGRRHPAPETVDGIEQKPIEGTSFALHLRRGECQDAVAPQDPVLRDDGTVGALRRRLVPEHEGESRAVGSLRRGQRRPAEQPGARTLST